jgi:putative chitinase
MKNPDLVVTEFAFESAIFFFNTNKLWSICDQGVDDKTITALTRRVNGGTHGLPDRIQKTKKFYEFVR